MTRDTNLTAEQLLVYLDELSIRHRTVTHPPLYTVADAKQLRGDLDGGHSKNLFLKSKKGRMWLVVVEEDQQVDLEALAETLGARRLSFGSVERLARVLGVAPGAVTPFAAVNDRDGVVVVAIGERLLRHEVLNFHPLVNDKTTTVATADLLRFLEATGHEPLILTDSQLAGTASLDSA